MSSAALVVVLSEGTASMVAALSRSGWPGPMVVVGSVEEARAALAANPATAGDTGSARAPGRPVMAVPVTSGPMGADDGTADLGIALDHDRQVVVTDDGDCGLTPLEFGVLEALACEPGRAWRFEELTRRIWADGDSRDWAPVHAVVRRLRVKLEQVNAPVEIVAVRGIGFRLERRADDLVAASATG